MNGLKWGDHKQNKKMENLQYDLDKVLDLISERKRTSVEELNQLINHSGNEREISKIGFLLIDNFKDEDIETTLVKLITNPFWKNNNGTFLYLLSEYTNDSKYLYFLIDLILRNKNDGEIIMGAYSMILNLQPPFERKDITKSLQKLRIEMKKANIDNERAQLVQSLINFLNGQRQIIRFYAKFGR
jgi:hypothetical protein